MKSMPMIAAGIPLTATPQNSASLLSAWAPRSLAQSDAGLFIQGTNSVMTTRLDAVPTRVSCPPRMAAKDNGM